MSVTVSILAFENLDLTQRCVESVLKASGFQDLILTDNGSVKEPVGDYFDSLAAKDARIIVIRNSTNLGFIEPNRRALERCSTRFFVLLNNDTVVLAGWLESLTRPFADQSCALSGPEECASRLRDDLKGYRCRPDELEYLEGSCLCCRADLMKEHGLFSGYLDFAYGEDADLGLRMREKGYTLQTVKLKIEHLGGATSAMVEGIRDIEARNHAEMRKRWATYLASRSFNFSIVIRRQGAMGDVLLITPIIEALSERFPNSPIWVETQAVDLFMNNPKVAGATRGTANPKDQIFINLDMSYENMPGLHIVESYRQTASHIIGHELEIERKTVLQLNDAEAFPISGLGERCVAIHCEPTTWPGKNWPADRWHELILWLLKDGWFVVLVGTSKILNVPCSFDARQQTSPLDLASVIGQCGLFIGHDSFPMHVAQSQGVPVIGLFGATRSELILTDGSPSIGINGTGPCAGARHRTAGLTFTFCEGDCMRSIDAESVKLAVTQLAAIPA